MTDASTDADVTSEGSAVAPARGHNAGSGGDAW